MRLSIFEALRLPATASEVQLRSSLRRLIRRLYVSSRDASGDVEEGLRFCNAASSVVLVESERSHYEGEYANLLSGGTNLRRSHAAQLESDPNDISDVSQDAPSAASGVTSVRTGLVSLLEISGGGLQNVMPAWGLLGALLGCAALAIFFGLRLAAGTGAQFLILIVALAATAAAVAVAIHRSRAPEEHREVGARLRDVAVVKWRRERSVFMGSRLKNEEAAWVYRLRVAETDRARNGRTSLVPAWSRFLARSIDYALWGALLYGVLTLASRVSDGHFLSYVASWWLFPMIVVWTWVPIEALLLFRFRTTPGKWLFSIRVRPGATALSAPDSVHESPRYSVLRAIAVAAFGMGAGIPILNIVLPALAARKMNTELEPPWDGWGDAVLTHVTISQRQAGLIGATLAATVAAYVAMWWPSFQHTGAVFREAQQLAPQVSWATLLQTNPKNWIPPELLDPDQWNASERAAKVSQTVSGVAANVASGVTAAVVGNAIDTSKATTSASAGESQLVTAKDVSRFAEYAEKANRAMEANNAGAAFNICQRWAAEQPRNAIAWKCYGLGLQMRGEHADALQALRKSQRIDPTDRSLHEAIRISFSSLNNSRMPQ